MTVFIHIGIGKTGTTAIQDSLYENISNLESENIIYPSIGLNGTGHHNLCPPGYEEGNEEISQFWRSLCEKFHSNPDHDFVISSENFIYATQKHLGMIFRHLSKLDIKVIIYVRQQTPLIESTYLQWQKMTSGYVSGIENFWKFNRAGFNYMRLISPWQNAFGSENIIARLFHPQIIGADVCHDFYKIINSQILPKKLQSSNESILPEFSRLIEKLDRINLDDTNRRLIVNDLLVCSRILKKSSRVKLIDSRMGQAIVNFYSDSNQIFADKFLSRDQAELFLNPT